MAPTTSRNPTGRPEIPYSPRQWRHFEIAATGVPEPSLAWPIVTTYPILVDAERRLVELVKSLAPSDLGRPTPCSGWDVRALLSHTLAGIEIFASTVDGQPAPTPEQMFSGGDLVG